MVIPHSYPLVGHVPRWLFDRFGFLEDCAASRLPIIELKLGRRAYLLNSPKDVGHVLDSCHQNYVKNPRLENAAGKKLFGDSIQTQYGTPHQHQRRQVQPALMRRAVAGFIPQIVSTVDHGLQAWYGKEIDLIERTLWLVNCVLGRVLFDLDFDGCDRKFGEAIVLRRQQVNRQFSLGPGLPGRRRQAHTLQWLQERVDTHIEARRRHPDRYADLLALLVQRQGPLTGPLIRDEAVGTSGGYETIGAMVIWTWYFLTQDPEIYARVQAEIESVLGQYPPHRGESLPADLYQGRAQRIPAALSAHLDICAGGVRGRPFAQRHPACPWHPTLSVPLLPAPPPRPFPRAPPV